MSFFVDIVTEDSFYENLTLGVVKYLENAQCVRNVRVDRANACERNAIVNWEQRHCCTLPEDVKNFYLSVDGFLLLWNLEISGEEFPVGRMEIGSLSSLKRYVPSRKDLEAHDWQAENENGSGQVKCFEIARCSPGTGKIYLAYRGKGDREAPAIYLHREENDEWHRLADNFTRYFRMMLVHLGLPLWQYRVAGVDIPAWVERIYFLVGPHLLPAMDEPTQPASTLFNNVPTNTLDPAVFKRESKQKNCKKK